MSVLSVEATLRRDLIVLNVTLQSSYHLKPCASLHSILEVSFQYLSRRINETLGLIFVCSWCVHNSTSELKICFTTLRRWKEEHIFKGNLCTEATMKMCLSFLLHSIPYLDEAKYLAWVDRNLSALNFIAICRVFSPGPATLNWFQSIRKRNLSVREHYENLLSIYWNWKYPNFRHRLDSPPSW